MNAIFKYVAVSVIALSVAFSAVTYAMVTDTFSANGTASTAEVNVSFQAPVAANISNQYLNWSVSGASSNSFSVNIENLFPGAKDSFVTPIVNSGSLAAILDSIALSFVGSPTDTMLFVLGLNVEVLGPNDVVLFNLVDASMQNAQADDMFNLNSESLLRFSSLESALAQQSYTFRVQPGASSSRIRVTIGMDSDENGQYTSNGINAINDAATENQSVGFTMAFNWSGETVTQTTTVDITETVPPLAPVVDIPADEAVAPPAAPVVDIEDEETPAVPTPQVVADPIAEDNSEVDIEESDVPLAFRGETEWALVNLLLAIFTAILSVILLLGNSRDKENNEGDVIKNKSAMRLFSLAPTISAIVTFFATQDMSLPLTLVDSWTILMVVIALLQCAVVIMSKKEMINAAEELN